RRRAGVGRTLRRPLLAGGREGEQQGGEHPHSHRGISFSAAAFRGTYSAGARRVKGPLSSPRASLIPSLRCMRSLLSRLLQIRREERGLVLLALAFAFGSVAQTAIIRILADSVLLT